MNLESGAILFDKYRIERLLGQGAFAQVFLATHLPLQAPRALKVLSHDTPGLGSSELARFRHRFHLEAQLAAQLEHPNIIRVFDFEESDELLCLVMEFAASGSLAQYLEQRGRQPLPLRQALSLTFQIAQGLDALHARDIVHRDLKPSNILLSEHFQAKIADLGLAQLPADLTRRTLLGEQLRQPGTPPYMSPEQLQGTLHLTPASDIYALGLILFEMLTGRLYRNLPPGTRLRDLWPEAPVWLQELLECMLDPDPAGRPWNGSELVGLLREGMALAERIALDPPRRVAHPDTRDPYRYEELCEFAYYVLDLSPAQALVWAEQHRPTFRYEIPGFPTVVRLCTRTLNLRRLDAQAWALRQLSFGHNISPLLQPL